MTEAFEGIDEFCRDYSRDPGSSPDTAEDWVFMMKPEDWSAVRVAWNDRPPRWREGCAYILGLGPVPESLPFLITALNDDDLGVATEGAIGYSAMVLENGLLPTVTQATQRRLEKVVALKGAQHLKEVIELLDAYKRQGGEAGV
jgi:HEAT repeat protein